MGALPRLCDVLQVLREERDQCLQELSKEKPGDPGVEQPAPGMWPTLVHSWTCIVAKPTVVREAGPAWGCRGLAVFIQTISWGEGSGVILVSG